MKLTTKQLKQMIVEELNEIYKGKNRTFYAPGPVKIMGDEEEYYPRGSKYRIPRETGAYIMPSEDPHSQLDSTVRDAIPSDSDRDALTQAYELSDALGTKPDDDLEDFLYGNELINDPDMLVRDAINALKFEIKRLKSVRSRLPKGSAEYKKLHHPIRDLVIRMRRLEYYKTLDRAYTQGGAVLDI
jgi:predicted house-cleaning noncanonical NTP pyrophosphatase (MazG superfamily)